jgi:hypothetical protein
LHGASTKNHGGIKVNPSALWLAHGFGQIGPTWPCGRWSDAFFYDDKLSNTATRIEEHPTGLRLRNGVLEEIKKPCTSVAPDLKEAMVARKKQLYNRRIEKKRATNNVLQCSASLN